LPATLGTDPAVLALFAAWVAREAMLKLFG
jgi:hypothetical protein